MTVKLLTGHHLEFLSFKGCCTGPSESTLVKLSHCWKSHVVARVGVIKIVIVINFNLITFSKVIAFNCI